MSAQDNMSLILTNSQELQLFNDDTVGSMMTFLDDQQEQVQQQNFNNLFEQDTYEHQLVNDQEQFQNQLVNQEEHHNGHNAIIPFRAMPDLLLTSLPAPPPSVISNEACAGPFNFEVFIAPHHGAKNPWVYSSILNKIYITVSNPFPVDFKWDPIVKTNMFVRARPLFSQAQHTQELVVRCIPHTLPSELSNRNVPEAIWDHVLRCQNISAVYHGSKEQKQHLSVVVPLGLPQMGTETVRIMYSFACKNSCPSGMNRKLFEVVFTLEDETSIVYGRRKLNVRVCSCPKRDKEKEERDFLKDSSHSAAPVPAKRQKTEKKPAESNNNADDTQEYTFRVTVCGKQTQRQAMQYIHDLMAGQQIRLGPNPVREKCMENIITELNKLDNK